MAQLISVILGTSQLYHSLLLFLCLLVSLVIMRACRYLCRVAEMRQSMRIMHQVCLGCVPVMFLLLLHTVVAKDAEEYSVW